MFSKQNRLKRKKDFEKVLKKGKTFKKNFLLFKVLENKIKKTRIGIIVSQKVSKKAIERNKLKRRIREIIRPELKNIKTGIDGVIIVLPGLGKSSFQETRKDILKIFEKAKITNSH